MMRYPRSMLPTPINILKNQGKDTIWSGAAHIGTSSANNNEEMKLKSNVGLHDPTTKRVIMQDLQKLAL